jgi:hypothetical protein
LTPTLTFTCSICGEASVSICVYCTKDACPNHLCERCGRCSDCCECDIRLDEHPEHEPAPAEVAVVVEPLAAALPVGAPEAPEPAPPATAPEAPVDLPAETHVTAETPQHPEPAASAPIDNQPQADNPPHE